MPDLLQTDIPATAAAAAKPAKPARAGRKPKRKASEVTIENESVDSHEGAQQTLMPGTPVKKAKTTTTREKKEKATKDKREKEKALQVKAEKGDEPFVGASIDVETLPFSRAVTTTGTATAKAAEMNIYDSPLDAAIPDGSDQAFDLDDAAPAEEDGEFDPEDMNLADGADCKAGPTPVPMPKIKSEPKAKPTKARATKARAAEKPKVEKVVKIKTEKGKTTTKELKDTAVAKVVPKEKKDKVEAVTGDAAVKLLLDYLTQQNRPYNGTDIITNLHGKVKKTLADKLLQEMAANGQIMGKHTGKTWIFWCVQKAEDAANPEELAVLDTTVTQLREAIPSLKTTTKNLSTQLQALKSMPTMSELRLRIESLEADRKVKQEKLQAFREGKVKKIEKTEMERVEMEWTYWSKKAVKRKRCFEDIEYELLAGMSKEEIWDKYDRNLATKRALQLMVSRAGIEDEDD